MEGPRALRSDEFEALRRLTDVVFRPHMPEQYPHLFNEDNRENLRVCMDGGKCVSHVGMMVRDASLFGCRIKVCCIGAVATDLEYRGQGLASACFDDAARKAYEEGVDVMLVSGDRSLYRRRGCMTVGRDAVFALSEAALPEGDGLPSVTTALMTEEELPLVRECYHREPVRFLRPRDDYRCALESGYVMNRPSDFLVVRERGEFRGYLIVQRPRDDRRARIAEFAGARRALLAAMPDVFRHYEAVHLHWQVQGRDFLFRSLCEGAGLPGTVFPSAGTVKLINFPQLMERMRPHWKELLGQRDAEQLSVRQSGDEYGFRFGDAELVTDRDSATRLLFGTVEGTETQAVEGRGVLTGALKTLLPLPCLWYGLNYV